MNKPWSMFLIIVVTVKPLFKNLLQQELPGLDFWIQRFLSANWNKNPKIPWILATGSDSPLTGYQTLISVIYNDIHNIYICLWKVYSAAASGSGVSLPPGRGAAQIKTGNLCLCIFQPGWRDAYWCLLNIIELYMWSNFGGPQVVFQTYTLSGPRKTLETNFGAANPIQPLPRISMEQLVVEKLLGSQKVFSTTNSSTEILGGGCDRVCCPLEVSHPFVSFCIKINSQSLIWWCSVEGEYQMKGMLCSFFVAAISRFRTIRYSTRELPSQFFPSKARSRSKQIPGAGGKRIRTQ